MVKELNRNSPHIVEIFIITQTMDAKLERMCSQLNCIRPGRSNRLSGEPLEHNLQIREERTSGKDMQLIYSGVHLNEDFCFTRRFVQKIIKRFQAQKYLFFIFFFYHSNLQVSHVNA